MTHPAKRLTVFFAALLAALLSLQTSAHGPHEQSPVASTAPSQSPTKAGPAKRESPGKGKQPHAPIDDYLDDQVLGWSLLVHKGLMADQEMYKEVRDELEHQLFRITRVLPKDKVELLRKVPIWLELNNPYSNNCQYHPSKRWLLGNGYLGEKANGIELSNAKHFVRSSQSYQPYVMLHELSHAYHDLHLGFDQEKIAAAYKKAKDSGSYDSVLHITGRSVRAYAMADHKEYFAEATEAYFGTNDHYPFVRAELKVHDPEMYEVVREAWGVK